MSAGLTPSSTDAVPSATITLLLSSAGVDSVTNGLNAMDIMSNKWSEAYASIVPYTIIAIALRSSACAALTILAIMSLFAIFSRRRPKQRSTQILVLSVLLLWVSNLIYWIWDLRIIFRTLGNLRVLAIYYINNNYGFDCFLSTFRHSPPYSYPPQDQALQSSCDYEMKVLPHELIQETNIDSDAQLNVCGSTAVLTVNIAIGDAVVWWRALALCPRQRFLQLLAIGLIASTFIMGVLDAQFACSKPSVPSLGEMYVGTDYGLAATILSLVTNMAATSVIAYKAWQHRRFIRANLRALSGRTQVQRVLGVLVESGAVYCVIWAFVLGVQLYKRSPEFINRASANGERLSWFAMYFLPTFFTPLIGMYPMVIILLVTLTRSRCDMLSADQSKPPTSIPLEFALRTISDGGAHSTIQIAVVSEEGRRASLDSRLSERPVRVSHPPRAASRRESPFSSRG